jgi:hypothetical protein
MRDNQFRKALLEGGMSASDLSIKCKQALLRDMISGSDSVMERLTKHAILHQQFSV